MSKNPLDISFSSSGEARERTLATTAITGLAGIGAAAAVAMAFIQPAYAQSAAPSNTFQSIMDSIGNGLCSTGPGCADFGAAGGAGGQVEVQGGGEPPGIEQRLRELRCKAEGNANCLSAGGAAADTMPFEGLNL